MFSSARAKIGRAEQHLKCLNAECRAFYDSKPYELRQEVDAEAGQGQLVYYPTATIPVPVSLIIGDLAYNLRSALDHVVYDLGGGVEMSEFPIYEERGKFYSFKRNTTIPTNISGLYKIRGITNQGARKIIEGIQPFNFVGEKPGQIPAILLLKKLCNVDKHRTLHLCRIQQSGGYMEFDPAIVFPLNTADLSVRELEDRAVIAWWALEPNKDMKVKAQLDLHIAFDEGEIPAITGAGVELVCENLIRFTSGLVDAIEAEARTPWG